MPGEGNHPIFPGKAKKAAGSKAPRCYDPSMVDEGMKTHFYVIMEGFFYESKNYSAHY